MSRNCLCHILFMGVSRILEIAMPYYQLMNNSPSYCMLYGLLDNENNRQFRGRRVKVFFLKQLITNKAPYFACCKGRKEHKTMQRVKGVLVVIWNVFNFCLSALQKCNSSTFHYGYTCHIWLIILPIM